MKKQLPWLLLLATAIACKQTSTPATTMYTWPKATPPVASTKPYTRILHGDTVVDNYYWMNDYFKKGPDSAKVVDYLEAENAYLDTLLSGTKKLQEDLYTEMKNRIKEKDEMVPVFKNGYFYYLRTDDGKQYFKYCRKKGSLSAPEEILLDVDEMAAAHPYYSVAGFNISEDNNLLAFGVDTLARRQYNIHVKDLRTGNIYPDKIHNTDGSSVWASDNKTLFYTANNPVTLLSEKIKRHRLQTTDDHDVIVYDEADKSNYIGVSKSKSGKFIFIRSAGTLSSETRYIKATDPEADFRLFQPRIKEVLYNVYALDDRFLVMTNLDAKNFRLMECPLNQTSRTNWKEVIPHRKDILLTDVDEFKNYLVLSERKNGLVQIRVLKSGSQAEDYLRFDEPTYEATTGNNPEYNTTLLRYNYTSLKTPPSVFDYNMATKERKLMKQEEVLGGYDKANYITERLSAIVQDGTRVPVSIVYRKDFKKDGSAPLLLYAYGSYGASSDAEFMSTTLSLLDRGFAFAIAHIRGGQEMGRDWYENGKLMQKKNTFTDYIDCAKYLVANHYTSPKHLYANGLSAGGLLMGAVANMAPELFNGIIAEVPFVDVINTMLDESIPLTTNEFDEWGNPKNKDAYLYMKSYSPYENVEHKDYPNMLVTTGLHDSQVQYFEPAKWVAKLRVTKTDNKVLLLKTNMDYGHGGASGRFDYLREIALNYAFMFALEGMEK